MGDSLSSGKGRTAGGTRRNEGTEGTGTDWARPEDREALEDSGEGVWVLRSTEASMCAFVMIQ